MRSIIFSFVFLFAFILGGCASHSEVPADAQNIYVGKDVSAYLIGEYMDAEDARESLEDAGFEVLAYYKPFYKDESTVVIFTNDALKKEAAKPGRAHMGVLRLFLDAKRKEMRITSPIYYGRAFMQEDFQYSVFAKLLSDLQEAFDELEPSKDAMNYDALAEYHFMPGMPYYEDSLLLAKAKTTQELVKRVQNYKEGKKVVFVLNISKDTTLIGYKFGKKARSFVQKIGRQNATILPWTISIEKGKATALDAKYYIAISYPLLDMSGFASIANIPGIIERELKKPFK